MLAVCTSDYAEKTASQYSSHAELKFALDEGIEVLPLKVTEEYPPKPPYGKDHLYDKDGEARTLVKLTMPKSKVYLDCVGKDAAYIAQEIAGVLTNRRPGLKIPPGCASKMSDLRSQQKLLWWLFSAATYP